MPDDDRLLDDVADAILDGTPIDWAAVESHAGSHRRALLDRLRVLAVLADAHRDLPHVTLTRGDWRDDPPMAIDERAAPLGRWGHLELVQRIGHGAGMASHQDEQPPRRDETEADVLDVEAIEVRKRTVVAGFNLVSDEPRFHDGVGIEDVLEPVVGFLGSERRLELVDEH